MIICPNLKNPDVAREFEELKNATSEAAAYHIWSLNNGNGIDKAPNGAESKLFQTLLEHFGGDRVKAIQAKAKVYSKSFLNWFGDWIDDPTNASKVVDENDEPLSDDVYLQENQHSLSNVTKTYSLNYNTELKLQETEGFNPFSYFKNRNYSVLCEKSSKQFEKYRAVARKYRKDDKTYGYPTQFFDEVTKVLYIKSNNYKNSRKYDAVDSRTGEYIKYGVTLFTYDEFEQKHYKVSDKTQTAPKTFSPKRAINFALLRQLPSKNRYKSLAKQFLYDVIDPKENPVNFKIIDDFVDSMPDALWDYISTDVYGFNEDQYIGPFYVGTTDTSDITAATSKINTQNLSINLPKLGLIKFAEKITGIKLLGRKVKFGDYGFKMPNKHRTWGEEVVLDNRLSRPEIEHLIRKILQREYFKTSSTEENIKHYASHHGISVEEVKERIELNREQGDMYASNANYLILNYDWQWVEFKYAIESEWSKIVNDYIKNRYKNEFTKNEIPVVSQYFLGVLPWIKIDFNLDSGAKDEQSRLTEPYVRLASVIHEPFHALHALVYGSNEELELRKAYENLINTPIGKKMYSLAKNTLALNTTEEGIYKEICAYMFQLMNTPAEFIDMVGDEFLSKQFFDFIKDVIELPIQTETVRVQKITTTTEIKQVKSIKTEYHEINLNFIQKLYNCLISALHKVIPLTRKYIDLINNVVKTEVEVTQEVPVEIQSSEEIETTVETEKSKQVQYFKNDFLSKLKEFEDAIKVLQNIDNSVLSSVNIDKFFKHDEQSFQENSTSEFSQHANRLTGVQLQLARAFGLVQQEDGSWTTDSSAPYAKLRVEFVNSLSHAGAYTHNSQADAMCHLIQIGLTHGDASTFNHELAHHYIRVFWNSKVVQDALNSVYNKKMGDINDPKVREAVEEKLVDMMTERSVDDMFKSNIEHKSFFQNFWEKFNTMLYQMFGIKNKTVRDALADNLTSLFMENEQLENTIQTPKIQMYEGTVYQSEYQKRTVKKSPTEKYNIHDLTRSDETVTQRIIAATQSKAKAYELRSTIGTIDGIYGDADQMARNQEAVRQVRIQKTLIEEAHAAHDAQEEIRQKVKLFKSFINMSNEEVTYILRLLQNAQANNYEKLMYVEDVRGNRSYTLQTGELITDANAPANAKTQPFGFDELQYAAEDVIGFIGPIIQAICNVISDAKMLGYTDSDIQELEDALHSTQVTTLMVNHIQPLYKSALQNKLFKWVDEVVDAREELSDDFKNRLRINMKKWLIDQQDFGDVGLVEVIAGMGSHSKSPIIRAMQDMINDMVEERDELVYKKGIDLMDKKRKAEKAMAWKYRVLPYNFQKLLMQLDDRGLPTGYFISEINKGQYIQDKNNYRDLLLFGDKKHKGLEQKLKELKDAAGNPIYVDENNKPIDKLVFDEYGFPVVPKNDQAEQLVKEYLTDFEVWRCRHSNRQFTERYYKDRIKYLSLDAMRALNRIDQKLEAITGAITINGVPRMDLLSPAQREEYLQYQTEKDFLGSIYNPDGSMKAPGSDEYNIAVSIRDFRLSMKGAIVYKTNTASYQESYNNAKDKADFERHFTHWQVNPEIYKYISQNKKSNRSPFDPEVIKLAELQYERNKLVQSIQGMSIGEIKWDKIYDENAKRIKNEQFLNALRSLDENINLLQGKLNQKYGKDNSLFQTIMEPYMIPYNRAGNWANSQSVFDKIKNDIRNSVFADPNLTQAQKQAEWFRQLSMLQYYCATKDVELPLDIFTTFLPRNKYTLDVQTGEQYVNFVQIPVSVFQMVDVEHSNPDYVNEDFDQTSSEYEQPIEAQYKDKRYDKYVKGNAELEELLTALKSTMEEDSWKAIPFLGQYDGRLPQIGARNGQILGRKIGTRLFKNLGEFFRREWEVVETDTEFSPDGDIQRRPDGSRIRNVPIRFVKMLDRPEYISADVVGSVIQFYNMAQNYRLKAQNASLLTRIMSMLRESDTGRRTGQLSRQYETMSGIIDRQLYENNAGIESYGDEYGAVKWGKFDWFRRWMVVGGSKNWIKRIGKARASMQIGTLAFNISSGIVSFLDPLLSLIVDASTGKYINIWNELQAIRYLIGNLFQSLFSLGKVKSYGKLGAAMQKFQLAKSNSETFSDTDKGQVYRFLSDGLKMKIFSWGDYTMNSISLIATMNNYHLYTDPSGNQRFLPKTLYISTYMKDYKCDANTARHEYRHSENMWDCCEVDRKTGEFKAQEKYEKIIDDKTWGDVRKQVRSRASMYNGIVPGNERTMMQNHPFFSFLTVLRNFMITGVQERFKNQRDFQVTTFDQHNNPSITDIDDTKTLSAHEAKHTQQYYKGGLNFDTRLIEDGIYTCMGNWLRHMLPYARFMFQSFASPFCKKFNTRNVRSQEFEDYTSSNKLNKNSIYSAQRVFLEILVIALMWNLVPVVRRIADDDQDDWFLQFLNLITLRVAIERTTWFSPNTFLDLIQSPTALYSDWKRRLKIIDLITESMGLSDYSPTDEVKTGNFKGVPRWEYNLLSALSGFGTHNWYTNMPKELGGGGAPVVRKKEGFYHKLIPDPAKWIFLPNKIEDEKGKKSRGSRSRSRSRSRNRRSRD